MAYCDYTHCDLCDAKAFYDADVDWDYQNVGEMKVLCEACAKTHQVVIVPKLAPGEEEHR